MVQAATSRQGIRASARENQAGSVATVRMLGHRGGRFHRKKLPSATTRAMQGRGTSAVGENHVPNPCPQVGESNPAVQKHPSLTAPNSTQPELVRPDS